MSQKRKNWSFDEDCENIAQISDFSDSSSDKDGFEVIPVKSSSDFEVIPQQQVRSLDENELEIHENYFLFGTSSQSQDSDSDIEVISKSCKTKPVTPLYSQVLQNNAKKDIEDCLALEESSSDDSTQQIDEIEVKEEFFHQIDNEEDDSEEDSDYEDDENDEDDDSDIEVLPQCNDDENDSLEIVFCSDANDEIRMEKMKDNSIAKREKSPGFVAYDDVEDYGIKTLFEETEEMIHEECEEFVALKTPTLAIIFCFCILAGVVFGSGFASVFVSNGYINQSNDERNADLNSSQLDQFLPAGNKEKKSNITDLFVSTNLKKTVKELLNSYRLLQEENEVLQTSLTNFKDRYHMQKNMVWYWKKQVKKSLVGEEHSPPQILNGLMNVKSGAIDSIINDIVNFSSRSSVDSSRVQQKNQSKMILDLQRLLEKEKEKSKFWMQKYSTKKLQKIRKCAKLGQILPTESFSFSSCLTMFTNALPDFNITLKFPNLTKPVESITDHVQSAWSKLKNRWQKSNDISHRNINRFKKMFSISNLINSARPMNDKSDKHFNIEKKYCADEAFRMFQKRWKEQNNVNYPKPGMEKKKSKAIKKEKIQSKKAQNDINLSGAECKNIKHTSVKTTIICKNGVFEQVMDEGFQEMQSLLQKKISQRCVRESYENVLKRKSGNENERESSPILLQDDCYACKYTMGVLIDIVHGKLRSITRKSAITRDEKQSENTKKLEASKQSSPLNDTCKKDKSKEVNEENFRLNQINDKKNNHTYNEDVQVWYKKQLDELGFRFDVYKWQTDGRMKSLVNEMLEQLKNVNRENKQKQTKNEKEIEKIKSRGKELNKEVRKYEKELQKLKTIIQEKQNKLDEWRFTEKLMMKSQIKGMKENLKHLKRKHKRKIQKVKKFIKSRIQKEFTKIRKQESRMESMKERNAKKVAYYKTKYQILDEELKILQKKYKELAIMFKTQSLPYFPPKIKKPYKKYEKRQTYKEHKNKFTKKNKSMEGENEKSWKIPVVYCSDQKSCQMELNDNMNADTALSAPTIFDLAHIYNYEQSSLEYTPVPPKPKPPRSIHPSPSRKNKLPPKPSPPKRIKESVANYSIVDEQAFPLSWNIYWGKNRDTYNVYEDDERKGTQFNWFLTMMKARESFRHDEWENFDREDNENWYWKLMRERELSRNYEQEDTVNWYFNWMEGRGEKYDN